MEKIQKTVRRRFLAGLILSVMLVGGIPLIVLGAVGGRMPMMILGIVCAVCGFYGTPLVWIAYADRLRLRRLVFAVSQEHLLDVPRLSRHLSRTEKDVRSDLAACVERGYLVGYLFDGERLTLNREQAPADREIAYRCVYCGAPFSCAAGEQPKCPYCGMIADKDTALSDR